MRDMGHTKGEWTIEPVGVAGNPNHRMITGHPNPKDFQVIRTIGRLFDYGTKEENEANARLIAAAPDLLAACEEYSKGVMLLREFDNEIMLGATLQLKKADDLGVIAITKAKTEDIK